MILQSRDHEVIREKYLKQARHWRVVFGNNLGFQSFGFLCILQKSQPDVYGLSQFKNAWKHLTCNFTCKQTVVHNLVSLNSELCFWYYNSHNGFHERFLTDAASRGFHFHKSAATFLEIRYHYPLTHSALLNPFIFLD